MSNNTVFRKGNVKTVKPDALDKVIALIFLKHALVAEEYEGCEALIAKARFCGARSREISRILAEPAPRVKRRSWS